MVGDLNRSLTIENNGFFFLFFQNEYESLDKSLIKMLTIHLQRSITFFYFKSWINYIFHIIILIIYFIYIFKY